MRTILLCCLTLLVSGLFGQSALKKKNPEDFVPAGYVVAEKIEGDLNGDGVQDCVLLIKGTAKNRMVEVENRGVLDRNRRGLLVLFKRYGYYTLALKNLQCFSSENEDGGVYFPPELLVDISNGKLSVHFAHGRYGYWEYTFRFQQSGFELIGYKETNGGAVVNSEMSINFLTKRKQQKRNVNPNAEGGDEVFREIWTSIAVERLIRLGEIQDFDELDMSKIK